MTNIDIDAIEKTLIQELQELQTDPEMDDIIGIIVNAGGIENLRQLEEIFGSAADPANPIHDFHNMANTAKQVYDAKGDQTAPKVLEFIEQVKTLTKDEYNNPFSFIAKTFLKEKLDANNVQEANPFNPS